MPTFFSSDFPETTMPDPRDIVHHPGLMVAAHTLGELVRMLETEHDIRLAANPDEDKFFRYHYPSASPTWELVDVHVERNGVWICPKQDLSFALLPSDRIHAGMLLC